ncbi:ROK family protein [Rubellimicrobium rubrum]|uniref:ROK family protein n=1 Tax=Rubellimicrobium rubrum TaxID=2585369 RepID=A0A5C4N282_9RHOB|nr:ROK family protein [Rubellimicrobium rubrum]TNC50424.1 ROK family protein [Rubellimicrobium rubrum]
MSADPDLPVAIGLDIGGTHLRAARVDADGVIQSELWRPTRRGSEDVLADSLELIAELRTARTAGVGVGIPGQVDAQRRNVLSGGYVDLSALPFAGRVQEATGLPVAIENDAAMALLAEKSIGAAQTYANVVLLTVGTGIGGAVLEQGQLLRGRGTAGQLGHLVTDPAGPVCLCGRRGCLETFSSGSSLARHVAEAGLPPGTRIEDLLDRMPEPVATAVVTAWAGPLRQAIDSLVAALNPDLVLLGGGLGHQAVSALQRLPEPVRSWYDAPIRPAALGPEAGVIGAGLAALRFTRAERKIVVLVNGVPASGKSTVARQLGDALGWPVLSLDTVKQPFLDALPPGDRSFNRTLGRASYRAMFDVIRDAPAGSSFVLDAWFGFQPVERLAEAVKAAGVDGCAELWCEAPPEEIGRRYAERAERRGAGHPGLEYVPELIDLAHRAGPTGLLPMRRQDTTKDLDLPAVLSWARDALRTPLQFFS